jgi:predicted  nucleic acid-binding Zn-ribbon protein
MTDDRGESDLTLQIEKLQARIKQLEETLSSAQDINDAHQRYNGKLQTRLTEVEEDNKKLSGQISDYIKKHEDFIRRAGI